MPQRGQGLRGRLNRAHRLRDRRGRHSRPVASIRWLTLSPRPSNGRGGASSRAAARPGRAARDGRRRPASHRRAQAPRRAGRHRHRQDARLPGAGHPVRPHARWWARPPRPCRTSWRARTSRSSTSTSTSRSRGPCSRGGPTTCACSVSTRSSPPRLTGSSPSTGWPSGCRPRSSSHLSTWADRPHRGPSRARGRAVRARLGRRQRDAHGSARVRPVARAATSASPRPPAAGRWRPTSSWSTSTSTASTWPSGGVILPEHELAIIDEAHQLEDIVSATSGVELDRRAVHRPRAARPGVIADDAAAPPGSTTRPARSARCSRPTGASGSRARPRRPRRRAHGRPRAGGARARRRPNVPDDAPDETRTRAVRLVQAASALVEDLERSPNG